MSEGSTGDPLRGAAEEPLSDDFNPETDTGPISLLADTPVAAAPAGPPGPRAWARLLRWRHYPLLAKILIVNIAISVVAITATGALTGQLARESLRSEAVASGSQVVTHFARTNATEWLDEQSGPFNLRLRLAGLVDADRSRILAAYALDRDRHVIASAGKASDEGAAALRLPQTDDGVVVTATEEGITVAGAVAYDKTRLGFVAVSFTAEMITTAGNKIYSSSALIIIVFLLLNVAALVILMRSVLRPVIALGDAAQQFARGDYSHRLKLSPVDDEISTAARSFNAMCDALELHMRFSNAALVERIRAGRPLDEVREPQLSVVFGDAKGYTEWSQRQRPAEIFATLNRYYTCFGRITVRGFSGIIDKFMGDGVMAHFGLPRGDDAQPAPAWHVRDALRAAVYMQMITRILNESQRLFEQTEGLSYRFGIASGRCLVGAIGAKDVMLDYSIIGNVVNLASRLQAKAPPGGLIIDRFTLIDAGEGFVDTQDMGEQQFKGVQRPINVFLVRSFAARDEIERLREFLLEGCFADDIMLHAIIAGEPRREQIDALKSFVRAQLIERPFLVT